MSQADDSVAGRPALEVEGLVKSYDANTAVAGLTFSVQPHSMLGLVGPNGAGKTTTLRCISGIIPATAGRIVIASHDLATAPIEARRCLAFVPDEPRLFDHLTIDDHLRMSARIYGVPEGRERGLELLRQLGLADRMQSFPTELSRGMKQKLSIALALSHQPRLLILDEPLTGLDPHAIRKMKGILRATVEAGAAVIVSSHLLALVEELCDRVMVLQAGRVLLEGTLSEIRLARPELAQTSGLEELFLQATSGEGES